MARTKASAQKRTGGFVWGQRRVDLNISIRQLAELTGINRGDLSKMERGRLAVPSDAFDAVMAALESPGLPPPGDSAQSPA